MQDSESDGLAEQLVGLFKSRRVQEARALLEDHGDPIAAAAALSSAATMLYRRDRDLPAMILAAEGGLAWCLERANRAPQPDVRQALKARAQAIAFNAAANCWPGWDDEGIEIDDQQVSSGLEMARRARELVQELRLEPARQGTAHWLVGALELAADRAAAARMTFDDAARAYGDLGAESAQVLMARGYGELAESFDSTAPGAAAQAVAAAVARLRALGSQDGDFFADQIETAQRVFAARARTGDA